MQVSFRLPSHKIEVTASWGGALWAYQNCKAAKAQLLAKRRQGKFNHATYSYAGYSSGSPCAGSVVNVPDSIAIFTNSTVDMRHPDRPRAAA